MKSKAETAALVGLAGVLACVVLASTYGSVQAQSMSGRPVTDPLKLGKIQLLPGSDFEFIGATGIELFALSATGGISFIRGQFPGNSLSGPVVTNTWQLKTKTGTVGAPSGADVFIYRDTTGAIVGEIDTFEEGPGNEFAICSLATSGLLGCFQQNEFYMDIQGENAVLTPITLSNNFFTGGSVGAVEFQKALLSPQASRSGTWFIDSNTGNAMFNGGLQVGINEPAGIYLHGTLDAYENRAITASSATYKTVTWAPSPNISKIALTQCDFTVDVVGSGSGSCTASLVDGGASCVVSYTCNASAGTHASQTCTSGNAVTASPADSLTFQESSPAANTTATGNFSCSY